MITTRSATHAWLLLRRSSSPMGSRSATYRAVQFCGATSDFQWLADAFRQAPLAAPRQVQAQGAVNPPAAGLAEAAWLECLPEQQAEAVPRIDFEMLLDRIDDGAVVARTRPVMPRRTRQSQHTVGPPRAQGVIGLHRQTQLQPLCLAQPFRDRTSFRAWCSSASSAYIRFSLANSTATSFRCRNCDTSIPAYLFFHT